MSVSNTEMLSPKLEVVRETLEQLKGQLANLQETLRHDPALRIDYLAVIPYRSGNDDDVPPVISPETLTANPNAVDRLVEFLSTIYQAEDQHPKSTLRAPGMIGVSPATMKVIQSVNTAKAEFKEAVKAIPTRQRRVMARSFPGLHRLQAYRAIVTLKTQPVDARFFWAANKSGVSKIRVEKLRDDLRKERDKTPSTDVQLLQAIDYDLEKLEPLHKDEVVSKKRAIQVHPQCNIGGGSASPEDAYLPIFYVVDAARPAPRISNLGVHDSLDSGTRRGVRSDKKIEDVPLLERIHVYRYLPEWREYSSES